MAAIAGAGARTHPPIWGPKAPYLVCPRSGRCSHLGFSKKKFRSAGNIRSSQNVTGWYGHRPAVTGAKCDQKRVLCAGNSSPRRPARLADPEAIDIVRHIVRGYEIIAENARKQALRNKRTDRKAD